MNFNKLYESNFKFINFLLVSKSFLYRNSGIELQQRKATPPKLLFMCIVGSSNFSRGFPDQDESDLASDQQYILEINFE